MVNANTFHNNSLQLFNDKIFEGILGIEHVQGKKISIKQRGIKYYGYFIEKNKVMYFIQDHPDPSKSILDNFPIKVISKEETDYNKNVFFFITKYNSVKIPEEKKYSFRQLINTIAPFSHSNPTHWLLYKIIVTAAWCSRNNFRVVAEKGFGKDSVVFCLTDLVGDTANIYKATFAKLEYSLNKKLLIFNEVANLKKEQVEDLQQFLLAIGAFHNKYFKNSRATAGTSEEYDISKHSLGVIYNPPSYYINKGQAFFDTLFTEAVHSRFIPFYLEGTFTQKFNSQFDVEEEVENSMQIYKDVISTLRYYRANRLFNTPIYPKHIQFNQDQGRHRESFYNIGTYLWEYCEGNQEEFEQLITELYNTHKKYDSVLKDALEVL
jgi:hypothetical protein